jgi:hypothetical protein
LADTVVALDALTVVIRGHFNAAIFSPAWLLQQNVIGAADFARAEVEIITRDFASMETGWLTCQVTPDALQLSTTEPDDFERLRDAAVSILNALPHTPVAVLGINREMHFKAKDPDHYQLIGDRLAPKDFWEHTLDLPVMREIVMWGQRDSKFGGRTQVKVEPSFRFDEHVFVSHSDQFNLHIIDVRPSSRREAWLMEADQNRRAEALATNIPIVNDILAEEWSSSLSHASTVLKAIASIS